MTEQEFDLAAMKKIGMIQQKQKEYFALRLRAVGGDLTSAQFRKVAEVADAYGRKKIHLTTRQGIEIHNVHYTKLEEAREELAKAGIRMGACGPRVRVVVACPGAASCRWGIIETQDLSKYLDKTYFGVETPHKFKIGVTGCPNNCAKASENDIGIMGAILPKWLSEECSNCDLCINVCPTKAIYKENDEYRLNEERCIHCSICTSSCPTEAWIPEIIGFSLLIGGTMGKIPRLATKVGGIIQDQDVLKKAVAVSIEYYQKHGRKKERFGHSINRIGVEKVTEDILDGIKN